ncbi:hypothetical protein ACEOWJ_003188 [Bacillus cereus]|uniref:hypothetical protein n=1 Tax=Bacillus TaxID=1386 RepID=UPI00054E7508|nr:hypothetical protein [Bacillus sp. UNC322MFChir4.1]
MNWSEVRRKYPHTFVLIEAVSVYSKDNKRMIQEMSVVDEYKNTSDAWNAYKKLHREFPKREFYIFHTSKEEIEVEEQQFIGVRGRI